MNINSNTRDELIASNMDFAKSIAIKVGSKYGKSSHMEDLISCAYLALVEAAGRFSPERGDFRAFAALRIRGGVLDYFRNNRFGKKGKSEAKILPFSRDEDGNMVEPEWNEPPRLWEELEGIDERKSKILNMKYLFNYSQKEIAERIGISDSRVSQILSGVA